MTSRPFLSAVLAGAMVYGLAVGAWAQAAGKPGRRPAKPDAGAAAADASPAPADETAAGAETPFGSSNEPDAKDPFDQAASNVKKGGGGKSGNSPGATTPRLEKATFGAGCFWHVEADFEWLPGVRSAVSGYAGGRVPNPSYEEVHEGYTGHIEVVQVEYDPSVITYEQLLKVFWHAHDPTQWNRQGPDVGTQYRSAIFFHNEAQRKAALKSYRELTAARVYPAPIVTLLLPMRAFYRAEEYHQNYYGGKPDRPAARNVKSRRAAKTAKKGSAATTRAAATRKAANASRSTEGDDPEAGAPPAER